MFTGPLVKYPVQLLMLRHGSVVDSCPIFFIITKERIDIYGRLDTLGTSREMQYSHSQTGWGILMREK